MLLYPGMRQCEHGLFGSLLIVRLRTFIFIRMLFLFVCFFCRVYYANALLTKNSSDLIKV